MFDEQVLAFTLVAAALTVTPGSDTLLVVKNAVRGGRNAGWATVGGILAGTIFHAVMSAVGLSVILAQSAAAFQVVKFAGAAYLVWLGVKALLERVSTDTAAAEPVSRFALRGSFREGLFTNILNPKVAIFYLAFLPQFIGPGDPVLAKSLLLASIHNLMGAVWLGSLSIVAARGGDWVRRPSVRTWISRVSGALLIGLGLRLAFDEKS